MPRKSARKIKPDGVADPLAAQDEDHQPLDAGEDATAAAMEAAAAAEAAEAAVDSLGLDSVGVGVHGTDGDDEMALAAAAAAAAVQAADGMAVVVDQALLATAAAAAASQVAASMPKADETATEFPQEVGDVAVPALPSPKLMNMEHDIPYDPDDQDGDKEDNLLAARRMKDRRRYATMSPTQRAAYNAHRRELYHKQGETARQRRRERERQRYHSLEGEDRKTRNARRAKLERDRYQKLSKEELADRNRKRRERAKARKTNAKRAESTQQQMPVVAAAAMEAQVPALPETSLDNPVDMSAVAAEVAEQVIGNAMGDGEVQV
mmetsp:Transcript_10671/g.17615  ORF Transcript_10671/g.17615 Transcript_10671/m.17615 type:complete len:322 (+) Transcript_10671:177-1142(+)|eukprot:scaffold203_cov149-Skeletonema_menzelii.AAC.7